MLFELLLEINWLSLAQLERRNTNARSNVDYMKFSMRHM